MLKKTDVTWFLRGFLAGMTGYKTPELRKLEKRSGQQMEMPSSLDFWAAHLKYWYWTSKAWLRNHTGRCASCPKHPRGPHKFGCSRRPGRGLKISVRRKDIHE